FQVAFDPVAVGAFTDTITIANNDANENPYTFVISGTGATTPPVAANDAYTTTEGMPLVIAAPGLLANDSDADGDSLTAILDTGPATGTLALNADGSLVYTPTLGYTGALTFTYHASDGMTLSAPATVTITVAAASVTEYKVYLPTVVR
ncbi:MAG: hypothetical protein GY788_26365, partial [bacterium]|nr:hypothetical protein [bacterium]